MGPTLKTLHVWKTQQRRLIKLSQSAGETLRPSLRCNLFKGIFWNQVRFFSLSATGVIPSETLLLISNLEQDDSFEMFRNQPREITEAPAEDVL